MDKLPVDMKKPHNQDLCSMCNKLGRKCTGIVEEDVSDDEKTKSNETAHRVIRKDGFEFKVRGGIVGTPGRGGGRGGGVSGRGFGENGGFGGGYSDDGFDAGKFYGDGAILFVGGLPYVSQEEVRNFLQEKIPNAQSVRVPMEQYEIGKIRGFAYVQLGSDADLTTVIDQVSNLKMGDKVLRIYESKSREGRRLFGGGFGDGNYGDYFGSGNAELGFDGNRRSNRAGGTLYVGGIPLGTSEVEVRDFLEDNIPNVDYVRVPFDIETKEIKGIAFVELLMHADITNVAMRIQGLKMDGKILTIKDARPAREEILTRDLTRNRRGYYRGRGGRGGFMNRSSLRYRQNTGSSGFEDVQTRSINDAFLVVHGLPVLNSTNGYSKEDVQDFLLDVIPHAEDVRIVTKMGGNGFFEPRAWVRLKTGTRAENVLRQVDGLRFGGRYLEIDQSMITWDVFESIDCMSYDEDYYNHHVENEFAGRRFTSGGGRGRGFSRSVSRGGTFSGRDRRPDSKTLFGHLQSYMTSLRDRSSRDLESDSIDSDDSTENLAVGFSGLSVNDRSTNVRKPVRSTRINSVSSARSLRSNSGSGFGRDTNDNFTGNRGGNENDDSDYEPDNDPERYHW